MIENDALSRENEALRRSNEQLQLRAERSELQITQFEAVHARSPDGMMMFRSVRDADDAIVDFEWLYVNESASRIVGRPSADLFGKRLLVEMPGNKEAGLFDIYVRVVESGLSSSHEFAYCHEGLDHWFRATSAKLGDGFCVTFADLTVRKRAEEQAARLAAIVRSSEHAIYSTSDGRLVETWNQGAERLFGYTSAEMIGQSILITVPESGRVEHEATLRRVLEQGGIASFQSARLTKAGNLVHVSTTISPIADADGRTVRTAVIGRDVSQEVKLYEQLAVADRMASVGTLAAGMAHEINNPLAYVTANVDLMLEELRLMGALPGRLKALESMALDARAGAERIRRIVRGLMTFSRASEDRPSVIELEPVLDLAVDMAFSEFRHRARVVKEYGEIPDVVADDARLGQVFINLLINAAQAMGDANRETNEVRITTSTDASGAAQVEIRDNGPGIPEAVLQRIFEPFFTTNAVGSGPGLGLSICRNIVRGMGGIISGRSNEGAGSTFRVVLPAAVAALPTAVAALPTAVAALPTAVAALPTAVAALPTAVAALPGPPPVSLPAAAPSTRPGSVLIVDDEAAVGIVLDRILKQHAVTVVTSATAALALIASGVHFDVILSDLMMPGMSGMQLYEELVRSYPEVVSRVIFMSGGALTPKTKAFLGEIPNERITKPFDHRNLRTLVQRFVTA